jgi:hypothetical protein
MLAKRLSQFALEADRAGLQEERRDPDHLVFDDKENRA